MALIDKIVALASGGWKQRRRPSTENVLGIAGFGGAAKAAIGNLNHSIVRRYKPSFTLKDKMDNNNDDDKLNFTEDGDKEDYKLGKVLAISAIVSDAPLGPLTPKRTKPKLFVLVLILGYFGFPAYSYRAKDIQATPILW